MTKTAKAPKHLTKTGADLWLQLRDDYYLTDAGQELLLTALVESWELINEAREHLTKNGLTILNPDSGNRRVNPAAVVLRDARMAFYRAIDMLNLVVPVKTEEEDELLKFFARR